MYDLNTYVDKIFYINLTDRPDRRTQIEAEFAKHNIYNYERVAGITLNTVPEKHGIMGPYNNEVNKDNYIKGSLGCLASHRSIFALALKRGYKSICIFEDDITLVEDFPTRFDQFITELEGTNKAYQFAYMGLNGEHWGEVEVKAKTKPETVVQVKSHAYGTHAYIVRDLGWVFKYVINNMDYVGQEVDLTYNSLIIQSCISMAYLSSPYLVGCNCELGSDIGGRGLDPLS
jgi:GR25 family glycosyltransferase involved in LPS biosynthesis